MSVIIKHPTAARYRALWAVFVLFCIFAVVAVLTGVIYLLIIGQEQRNRLVDCTTPGHECYDQGQEQTGKIVGGLNDATYNTVVSVVSAALSCYADGIKDQEALAHCTVERSKP